MSAGAVFWFTGLSGSGKTTLARQFAERLRQCGRTVIMLDGDELRVVFGNDLGHSVDDRRASAMRNARLCQLISSQGVDVVCATISMFHACHEWNRLNLPRYHEVFVDAPLDVLRQRDPHGLYARAARGEVTDVVGIDIRAEMPQAPHASIANDGRLTPEQAVGEIWMQLGMKAEQSQ